jgi:hypothetical protein
MADNTMPVPTSCQPQYVKTRMKATVTQMSDLRIRVSISQSREVHIDPSCCFQVGSVSVSVEVVAKEKLIRSVNGGRWVSMIARNDLECSVLTFE